jgi:hypothetical protein
MHATGDRIRGEEDRGLQDASKEPALGGARGEDGGADGFGKSAGHFGRLELEDETNAGEVGGAQTGTLEAESVLAENGRACLNNSQGRGVEAEHDAALGT